MTKIKILPRMLTPFSEKDQKCAELAFRDKEIERLTQELAARDERIESMISLIGQFDAAIRRIAHALGDPTCGGVDTGDNINPDTGEPYGHGGHTAYTLEKSIREHEAKVLEEAATYFLHTHGEGTNAEKELRRMAQERRNRGT